MKLGHALKLALMAQLSASAAANVEKSWYCDQCQVEVYQLRCPHCGKTEREER